MKLTVEEKQVIINLHVRKFKGSFIAHQLNRHRSTISKVINEWKKRKYFPQKKKFQRKRKLTAQQIVNVLKYFIDNPFHTYAQCIKKFNLPVHRNTIGNILAGNKMGNFVACPKQFLSLRNQIRRLKFALKYRHWSSDQWKQVHFIDEKTVQTYSNGKLMVKRRLNERYDPEKMKTDEKQNTKNKLNLFGVVSYNGPNTIYSVSTNLKSIQVEQLMRKKVMNIVQNSIVLIDNAKIHLQGVEYLSKRGVKVIDFPPKSNDANIIENVWGELQKILNHKLRHITVSTKDQLLKLVDESWRAIPSSYIQKCILSMPTRLEEIIKMKGKQTRF